MRQDFEVSDDGERIVMRATNDIANRWLYEAKFNRETQWWKGGVVVAPSSVWGLLMQVEGDGFTWTWKL